MNVPTANGFAPLPTPSTAVTRRYFMNGTATLAGGAAAGALFPASPRAVNPPPSTYDLRTDGFITSVKNQDLPTECNSCTAFAIVAMVEGAYNKKNNLSGTNGPDLDEMGLFTQPAPPPGGCQTSHWWPKYALERCKTDGLAWQGYPTKPRVQIARFDNLLETSLQQTKTRMKNWVFNTGPVVAVMLQFDDFYKWGKHWTTNNPSQPNPHVYAPGAPLPGSGGAETDPGPIVGGHVVSIVGYDDAGPVPFWICKNSWGDAWNGDGYVRIAQGKPRTTDGPQVQIGRAYV